MKYLPLMLLCTAQAVHADTKEPYDRGYGALSDQTPAAFNAPAEVKVKERWEWFTSATFLYQLAEEEGLDLAVGAALVDDNITVPPLSKTLFQNSEWSPGFKVGIGIDTKHDDWLAGLEYTWFRQTSHTSSTANATAFGVGVWFLSNWFIQPNAQGDTISATRVKSEWNLQMDLLDGYLSRSFYQGRMLTIAPFVGLRAAWISQSLTLQVKADPVAPTAWVSAHNKSNSWALGPRMGLKGHWLLGAGLRIESDIAASVLYTRYPSVYHSEDATSSNTIPVAAEFKNYGCLRSIAECGLGLGWGTYFNNNTMAVDLLASYDFSIYWNQNLIRRVVDLSTLQENASPSNLYLQGLALTLRFDY